MKVLQYSDEISKRLQFTSGKKLPSDLNNNEDCLKTTIKMGSSVKKTIRADKYSLRPRLVRNTKKDRDSGDECSLNKETDSDFSINNNNKNNNRSRAINTNQSKNHKQPKPKQKPAPLSKYRRKTANARERSRMREINTAFETLRRAVPHVFIAQCPNNAQNAAQTNEKLTKITTLRLAMKYISALSNALNGPGPENMNCVNNNCENSGISHEYSLIMDNYNPQTEDLTSKVFNNNYCEILDKSKDISKIFTNDFSSILNNNNSKSTTKIVKYEYTSILNPNNNCQNKNTSGKVMNPNAGLKNYNHEYNSMIANNKSIYSVNSVPQKVYNRKVFNNISEYNTGKTSDCILQNCLQTLNCGNSVETNFNNSVAGGLNNINVQINVNNQTGQNNRMNLQNTMLNHQTNNLNRLNQQSDLTHQNNHMSQQTNIILQANNLNHADSLNPSILLHSEAKEYLNGDFPLDLDSFLGMESSDAESLSLSDKSFTLSDQPLTPPLSFDDSPLCTDTSVYFGDQGLSLDFTDQSLSPDFSESSSLSPMDQYLPFS